MFRTIAAFLLCLPAICMADKQEGVGEIYWIGGVGDFHIISIETPDGRLIDAIIQGKNNLHVGDRVTIRSIRKNGDAEQIQPLDSTGKKVEKTDKSAVLNLPAFFC